MIANNFGTRLIKIASLYLLLGIGIAFFMVSAGNLILASVHSHILLLGWMSLGIIGLVYLIVPECGHNRLAAWHFWLHNIGLPVMMLSLAIQDYGHPSMEPVTGIGSLMVAIAILLFTINVFKNLKSATR